LEKQIVLGASRLILVLNLRWFGEIIGYFEQRTTNGTVEGINDKLKLIKRAAYGFRNFNNFRLRSLLSWHFPVNLA